VKNTPEKVVPGAGDVTKGINMRDIRFCSAMTLFSTSSGLWMSKDFQATLTNLIIMLQGLVTVNGSTGPLAGSTSYMASSPDRKKTCVTTSQA
jgi:hypothetical protein